MQARLKTKPSGTDLTLPRKHRSAAEPMTRARTAAEDAYWTLARKVDQDLEDLDARADRLLAACR